ncbi:hypothetical protein [Quatrionicoccus australiensis]|jgi:hypothetical protein|uniref:hypothetical protein n=1 Tax=Quatrionicoccus australiensis TaxID=138118 RepID=UPI000CB80245|nr:hypothetical protein [Quatrionicoccus australiensis]MCB4361977.1 hypothetical protein [Quatrionicoccus australiensis]MDD2742493.1 hypothetical protein [Rhodocyclaceae bacterium]PKO48961.1 MAG: hypothetical protein CVU31_02860 [Betaproteobacteria bacterium HGW-Betaproteobacteria-4]TXT26486.1 MAG: hypothetical protein FD131_4200 [Rhodocyclaceae bacterium]
MTNNLWRNHILPFTLLVGLLGVATLVGDYLLHRFNLVWIGRYLGIPGTLLIIGSLIYSLRKRKMITSGNMKSWLSMHEVGTWLGSLMVLLHAGIHFNAILPWLATVAMGVNVISGMVGKLLLGRSREHVLGKRDHYQLRGLSKEDIERAVFWDAVTLDAMTKWRKVHIPIFIVFAVLALGHIISIFLFWGWV